MVDFRNGVFEGTQEERDAIKDQLTSILTAMSEAGAITDDEREGWMRTGENTGITLW
jgi:hypothetical protein